MLLGDFLLKNYTSSLNIIKESHEILETTQWLHENFNLDHNCLQWLHEEQNYIASLNYEPQEEKIKIEYLDAIEHFEQAQWVIT